MFPDQIGTNLVRSDKSCPLLSTDGVAGEASVSRSNRDKPCPIGQELSAFEHGWWGGGGIRFPIKSGQTLSDRTGVVRF